MWSKIGKLLRISEDKLGQILVVLFILGSIASAFYYDSRTDNPLYFIASPDNGPSGSTWLFITGTLVFFFGFIPRLFELKKHLSSTPEKEAEKMARRYDKNLLHFEIGRISGYHFASTELRQFMDWLGGNADEIDPKDIPEFKEPSVEETKERVQGTINLFIASVWCVAIGLILR